MKVSEECDPRYQPTPSDLRYLSRFPDRCAAEVSRGGECQPCDKVAVAVTVDDHWWPVCVHHSRGRCMVPLADLLRATRGGSGSISVDPRPTATFEAMQRLQSRSSDDSPVAG